MQCAEVFSWMTDVTHLIYAAVYEKPGLVSGWRERERCGIMDSGKQAIDDATARMHLALGA